MTRQRGRRTGAKRNDVLEPKRRHWSTFSAVADTGPGGRVRLELAVGVHMGSEERAPSPASTTTPDAAEVVDNGNSAHHILFSADEPEVDGGDSGHSGGARVGSELGIDAGQVIFDGAFGQVEACADGLVGQSVRRPVRGLRSHVGSGWWRERGAGSSAGRRRWARGPGGAEPPFTQRCRLSPIDGSGCAMWPRSRTARARPAKPFRSETPHDPVEYRPIVQALLPRPTERGQQRLHEGSPGTGQYRLLSDWRRAAVGAELPDRAGAAPAQTPERNRFRRRCDRRLRHHQ